MAHQPSFEVSRRVRFDVGEVTGAIGDSITVLPIVVALAVTTRVSLPHALLFFGVFQVVWGLRYGLPVSVEPMKALAGLAIAGGLTYGEFLGAGLLAGVVLLALAATGTLSRVEAWIGTPVIRGIQLAVALILLQTGVELALGAPGAAVGGLVVAGVVIAAGYRRASALVVLGVGVAVVLWSVGLPEPSVPAIGLFPEGGPAFTLGTLEGALAQLAMTVGNAAVATALLFDDLLDADVSVDDLAGSMGGMCLVSVPLGGIPMCHGSGGLAGKYAFGARTGGANVVLGGLYLLAA
ncbi:MAG: putative sulfate/molybdate transporter, partial [Halobacteriales archaeon]